MATTDPKTNQKQLLVFHQIHEQSEINQLMYSVVKDVHTVKKLGWKMCILNVLLIVQLNLFIRIICPFDKMSLRVINF